MKMDPKGFYVYWMNQSKVIITLVVNLFLFFYIILLFQNLFECF